LSVAVETVTLGSVVPEMTEVPDEIALEPGDEQVLLLPSSAGAGYVWEAEVEDEAVVEATVKFEGADDAAVGARTFGKNELLTLRGCAEGTTRVHLVQRRTWEEGVEPKAARTLTVNVAAPAEATERGGTQ
jgi:predicted secreted protein